MANPRIAWIGIGHLGTPIVQRLIDAGYRPTLYDVSADRLEAFAGKAALAASAAEAAAADLIFSTLPNDAALASVAADVFAAMPGGASYIDLSTVSPDASAAVAARAEERSYLRAPVSGSVSHAEKGILTVLASGPQAAYELAAPVFDCFCGARFHVGSGEEARYLKLMINNLVGSTAALMAESLALGRKAGLDWEKALDVIAASAVASPLVKYKTEALKARDFSPAFTTALMIKDMKLFCDAASALGCAKPLADETLSLLEEQRDAGMGEEDFFATVKLLENKAGLAQ